MSLTKILILLSTYNGEKFIREQLDSLLEQEGVDVRILARDDGSKDATWSILEKYKSLHPDVFHLIKGANIGFALSFTDLLREAVMHYPDMDYFAFCDQDDVWLPKKLAVAIGKLSERSETEVPMMYCSNLTVVDEHLNVIRQSWNPDKVKITKERAMIQSFATGCTIVFNRKAAETYVSHLPEVIKVHDYLMYQLCVFLGEVIWDKNSYILYRQHGRNQIGKKDFRTRMKVRCSSHYKEHALELQNRYFLSAFKDLLSVDNIAILSRMVFYKTNFLTKLSLLFSHKIQYTDKESNFFYRIKVLLGGV